MRNRAWVFAALLVLFLVVMMAAAYRTTPLTGVAFRPTVLTTVDTVLSIPGGYHASQTMIVNDGTGRLYVNFTDTAIDTATDFFVEPAESVPTNIPWSKMHLKATGSSSAPRILASY